MPNIDSKFSELEKKIIPEANDNHIKKAIKDLHDSLSNEIERNRKNLFFEVKNTLVDVSEKLEKGVAQETEKKISELFEKHIQKTKEEFQSRFEQFLEPAITRIEEDMQRLHIQGANTLRSWEQMMSQYEGIWSRPFFVMFMSSILTGCTIFLILFFLKTSLGAYMFMDLREKQAYENELYKLEYTQRLREDAKKKYRIKNQQSNTKK